MSRGIRDRVAIVGMGCTRFAEHWHLGAEQLMVEAVGSAVADAGITTDDLDACWLGTMGSAVSGLGLSRALRLEHRPVTRVENMCATGSDAFRQACYAVAAGVADVALVVGVEKLKDSGFSGLVDPQPPNDGTAVALTAPSLFSFIAPAYASKYGVPEEELSTVLARIAAKNHHNGARHPLAQFRREVSIETVLAAPRIAGMLGVYDCSGVSDGAAAAIVVPAEHAHRYTDRPVYVKGMSMVAGPAAGVVREDYDFTTFPETVAAARNAYAEAGVDDPRAQLAMAEVHDCFTPTELVIYEDLGLCARGTGWREVLDGSFELDGDLPVNPDGGLKAFGHPIGASGLRMLYECWLQLRGDAPAERAVRSIGRGRTLALTHNLGGSPGECVAFVGIVGSEPTS